MTFTNQQLKAYKILQKATEPLSVKEIAYQLKIVPNSIYRLLKPLIETGLIVVRNHHPSNYSAVSPQEGLGLFLLNQSSWFQEKTNPQNKLSTHNLVNKKSLPEEIALSFIQGREQLMDCSVEEIDKSVKSVDLLRSGHEMPSEVIRAIKQAIQRGVTVRMLIQELNGKNEDLIKNWIRNGISVRQVPFQKLRLMVFDSQSLYFMSYKHSQSTEDMGMKVLHSPLATMLKNYFDTLWKNATKVEFKSWS